MMPAIEGKGGAGGGEGPKNMPVQNIVNERGDVIN